MMRLGMGVNATLHGCPLVSTGGVGGGIALPTVASIVGFGDSIMFGQAATTAANQWINRIATVLGAGVPLNQGLAGTVLQNSNDASGGPRGNNGRNRFAAALLGGNAREMAVVAYGFNDARYIAAPATFNVTEYAADLREVLNGLRAGGYAANRILVVAPYYITDTGLSTGSTGFSGQSRAGFETFVAAAQSAAQDFGTYFYDAYAYMRDHGGAALISNDSIHPVDLGHQAIAEGALAASAILNVTDCPASVTLISTSDNTASVAFGAVSGATSYEVQLGVDGTYTYTITGAGAASPLTLTGIAAGIYRSKVRAVMGMGVYGPWGFSSATATVANAAPTGPFLNDSFTEAVADTVLTSHIPEVGGAWVRHGAGGASLMRSMTAGRFYSTGTTSVFVNSAAPSSANYYVEAVLNAVTALTGDVAGIAGRMDPAINTMYLARYTKNSTQWQLLKLVAGAATTLGTFTEAVTIGADMVLRLEMNGANIRLLVNAVEKIAVTDADISAAGRAGLRFSGSAQSATTGVQISAIMAAPL